REHVAGVRRGTLQVARELHAQVADHAAAQGAGESKGRALSGHIFFAILRDGAVGERTGRIEEDVVSPVKAGDVDASGERVARRERVVELGKSRVAEQG